MNQLRRFFLISTPLLFLLTITVFAQTAIQKVGMILSPPTFEITARRGEEVTNVVRFENPNGFPLNIITSVRNFTAQGEEGAISLSEEESPYSLASWVEISPKGQIVPARSTQQFTFTINVPENAEAGGHFGSLIFSTKPSEGSAQTGAAVSQEVASLILLKIPGATSTSWDIESFSSQKSVFWSNPVSFIVRVKNTGSVHVKPAGRIELTDIFGKKTTLELSSKNVFPGAIRRLESSGSVPLIGYYRAKLFLEVAGKQKTRELSFFALPGKVLLIIFAVVLFLFIVARRSKGRLNRAVKVLFGRE